MKNTLTISKRMRDLRMNYKKEDETSGRHNKSMFCNVGESWKTVNNIDCTKKQKKQLEEI